MSIDYTDLITEYVRPALETLDAGEEVHAFINIGDALNAADERARKELGIPLGVVSHAKKLKDEMGRFLRESGLGARYKAPVRSRMQRIARNKDAVLKFRAEFMPAVSYPINLWNGYDKHVNPPKANEPRTTKKDMHINELQVALGQRLEENRQHVDTIMARDATITELKNNGSWDGAGELNAAREEIERLKAHAEVADKSREKSDARAADHAYAEFTAEGRERKLMEREAAVITAAVELNAALRAEIGEVEASLIAHPNGVTPLLEIGRMNGDLFARVRESIARIKKMSAELDGKTQQNGKSIEEIENDTQNLRDMLDQAKDRIRDARARTQNAEARAQEAEDDMNAREDVIHAAFREGAALNRHLIASIEEANGYHVVENSLCVNNGTSLVDLQKMNRTLFERFGRIMAEELGVEAAAAEEDDIFDDMNAKVEDIRLSDTGDGHGFCPLCNYGIKIAGFKWLDDEDPAKAGRCASSGQLVVNRARIAAPVVEEPAADATVEPKKRRGRRSYDEIRLEMIAAGETVRINNGSGGYGKCPKCGQWAGITRGEWMYHPNTESIERNSRGLPVGCAMGGQRAIVPDWKWSVRFAGKNQAGAAATEMAAMKRVWLIFYHDAVAEDPKEWPMPTERADLLTAINDHCDGATSDEQHWRLTAPDGSYVVSANYDDYEAEEVEPVNEDSPPPDAAAEEPDKDSTPTGAADEDIAAE